VLEPHSNMHHQIRPDCGQRVTYPIQKHMKRRLDLHNMARSPQNVLKIQTQHAKTDRRTKSTRKPAVRSHVVSSRIRHERARKKGGEGEGARPLRDRCLYAFENLIGSSCFWSTRWYIRCASFFFPACLFGIPDGNRCLIRLTLPMTRQAIACLVAGTNASRSGGYSVIRFAPTPRSAGEVSALYKRLRC
jgi:hypothetical protein